MTDNLPVFVCVLSETCGACQRFKPSWPAIKQEIEDNGLANVIEIVKTPEDSTITSSDSTLPLTDQLKEEVLDRWVNWYPCFLIFTRESWLSGEPCGFIFNGKMTRKGPQPLDPNQGADMETLINWTWDAINSVFCD